MQLGRGNTGLTCTPWPYHSSHARSERRHGAIDPVPATLNDWTVGPRRSPTFTLRGQSGVSNCCWAVWATRRSLDALFYLHDAPLFY